MNILAIDIGNTNITLGVFKGKKLAKRCSLPTRGTGNPAALKALARRHGIKTVVICSVVPGATLEVRRALKGLKLYNIGKELKVPIKNRYRNPRQVGADRLVNAYAALKLYGAPAIVVDFGTGVTFDIVSGRGEYLGGMILPGLGLSLKALKEHTALLPEVRLRAPKEFIGRDTASSMLSGLVHGFACLTDELNKRIAGKIGGRVKIIVTGGDAKLVAGYATSLKRIDPDLTLKGIQLIYQNFS
jgi:type III pantothenate kinase